jgi:tetratricopeptide (TPR) repeat protein
MLDEAIALNLESSDSTIEIAAVNAEDYYHQANIKYYELQDIQGGLSDYDRAIELDPNHALAYSNRGNIKKDHQSTRSCHLLQSRPAQKYQAGLSGVTCRLRLCHRTKSR